eukprot:CFRG0319T1
MRFLRVGLPTIQFLAERNPILSVVYDTTNLLTPSDVVLRSTWESITSVVDNGDRPDPLYAIGIVYEAGNEAAKQKAEALALRFLETHSTVFVGLSTSLSTEEVKWIDTPTLQDVVDNSGAVLVDTRRRDELRYFGSIPTACNVPVEEICVAFAMEADVFKGKYGFEIPSKSTNIVTYCRTNRRSHFCSLVLHDLGYESVKAYKEGVVGWAKEHNGEHCSVKGYEAYEQSDTIPTPFAH